MMARITLGLLRIGRHSRVPQRGGGLHGANGGFDVPVFDADVRVVIVVQPTSFVAVNGGLTLAETIALTERLNQLAADEKPQTSQ
jgi:hypothetical protein